MENGDQIRAVLDHAVKDGKLPMSVALVANSEGVLFTHASGYRDSENGQMMRPDSIFAQCFHTSARGSCGFPALALNQTQLSERSTWETCRS